ncbi:MAG: hypothetical protein K8T25_20090 [Planctomycetia bacterium]|nr:hypothetical protein [Planctomycetia bacterium]
MNSTLPELSPPRSAFARLSPVSARCVLWSALGAVVLFVAITVSPRAKGFADKPSRGPGDVALYRAEVDRIQAGESYYSAAFQELHARGYPTRSVFNWRTPLPIWLIGSLPRPEFGKLLLGLIALATLGAAFELLAREGGTLAALPGTLAIAGAMFPCLLGDLYVMPVLWAGVMMLLSISLLSLGRMRLGVVTGVGALFLRELAGPYCLVALLLALGRRRFREAAWWTAGLAVYGAFFLWHISQVHAWQTPYDRAHQDSWIQFGGAAFVISLVQMNGWLLCLPQFVAAIALALALLGFAGWSTPAGERAGMTAGAYVLLFGFVGQDFNQYWGSLIAPLLGLGIGWSIPALRDLIRAARAQSRGSVSTPRVDDAASAAAGA